MDGLWGRVAEFVRGRVGVSIAVVLMAIRFASPAVIAAIGVGGADTAGLNDVLSAYAAVLPGVLFAMSAAMLASWPGGFRRDPSIAVAIGLTLASAVLWAGEVDSSLRIVTGPWASLPLGLSVSSAIVAYGAALEIRLRRAGSSGVARTGLRNLVVGFGLAYLLRSLRLVDYAVAIGQPLPTGVRWALDYAPTLLLSFLAVLMWVQLALIPARTPADRIHALVPTVAFALAGLVAATGLAGFIVTNALTWGGSYALFSPTLVSLPLVSFGIGAFVATSWVLRSRVPAPAWHRIFGGVVVAAFAGLLAFGGSLASLAGIVLGATSVARGIAGLSWPESHD